LLTVGNHQFPKPASDEQPMWQSHLVSRIGLDLMLVCLHHTMRRTRTVAALPSVIGGPGGDFNA
jgi:hypothetical protein